MADDRFKVIDEDPLVVVGTPGPQGIQGEAGPAGSGDPDAHLTGQYLFPRRAIIGNPSLTSKQLMLTYFTGARSFTATKLAMVGGSVVAAPSPTICRFALYTIDGSDNLTLAGATPNDTTMFATANTRYERAMSTSVPIVAGTRYAFAFLIWSSVALPRVFAMSGLVNPLNAYPPRMTGALPDQDDLPASIAAASIVASDLSVFGEVLP